MFIKNLPIIRGLAARIGPFLLLLQKSPVVQMLFPQARILGTSAAGELVRFPVAAVAGLCAFDGVAGASTVAQVSPNPGSTVVPAVKGKALSFVYQFAGSGHTPGSWSVTGLPQGLVHNDTRISKTDSVSGIPTVSGIFPVKVTAYRNHNRSGDSVSTTFSLQVVPGSDGPEISLQHPAGKELSDGISGKSFGSATVGLKGRKLSFRIRNAGTAALTGISVGTAGAHRKDFLVSGPGISSLAAQASATFTVVFSPKAVGTRSATLRISSNDADENPFDIKLRGIGTR